MNTEQARFNLVEQQVRTWNVLDADILDTIASVPREKFIPATYQHLAFADTQIPLNHGQAMALPREDARMLQALELQPSDRVLEIGTGTGYATALMASLCHHVFTVELYQDFIDHAQELLAEMGYTNITFNQGDAAKGWTDHGPFDAIAITGAVNNVPTCLFDALKENGRLFAIEGDPTLMTASLYTKKGKTITRRSLYETRRKYLVGAEQPTTFNF